jgi:hypothetical protein
MYSTQKSNRINHVIYYIILYYLFFWVGSDLRQFGVFLRVLRFPPPIKLTAMHDITEILLKVAQTPYETKPVTILSVFCCFLVIVHTIWPFTGIIRVIVRISGVYRHFAYYKSYMYKCRKYCSLEVKNFKCAQA